RAREGGEVALDRAAGGEVRIRGIAAPLAHGDALRGKDDALDGLRPAGIVAHTWAQRVGWFFRPGPAMSNPHNKFSAFATALRRTWALAIPYFSSEDKWRARSMLAGIVVLNLAAVYMLVQI